MFRKQIIQRTILALTAALLSLPLGVSWAAIDGITGTSFTFAAREGRLSTPDGGNILFWGFADTTPGGRKTVQYPGPTLILNQDDTVTITLSNELKEPVSMMFPGMTMLSPTAPVFSQGQPGRITSLVPEAAPGGTRVYRFKAEKPGTFYYQSGSNQAIQLRMGLFGAIVIRPKNLGPINVTIPATLSCPPLGHQEGAGGVNAITAAAPCTKSFTTYAYEQHESSAYDREFLYMATEMDPKFQQWMEFEQDKINKPFDFSSWKANYWFINGRNAPDTMAMPNAMNLPAQPYNCMPLFHPGERVLIRIINMGQEFHPLHTHGNHMSVIAEDGNVLKSPGGTGADLSWEAFTVTMAPGKTFDAIFSWTGKGLGWDIYEDATAFRPYEYIPDHLKKFEPFTAPALAGTTPKLPSQGLPVIVPGIEATMAGPNWSGSPFFGSQQPVAPGEGGFNPFNGFFYMWHSHSERELTNNNIFPGGFMTMAGVVPWPDSGDNLTALDEYMP